MIKQHHNCKNCKIGFDRYYSPCKKNKDKFCTKKCANNFHTLTHGHSTGKQSRTYCSWSCMMVRCYNKKHKHYNRYGGRGIKVCDNWHKFDNFLKDMGERPLDKTLDRIDNNKGYSKENCKWSTRFEQQSNQGKNIKVTYNGETKILNEWSRIYNLPKNVLRYRLLKSWEIEKALLSRPKSFTHRVYKKATTK